VPGSLFTRNDAPVRSTNLAGVFVDSGSAFGLYVYAPLIGALYHQLSPGESATRRLGLT
jgi:hypothetical protein